MALLTSCSPPYSREFTDLIVAEERLNSAETLDLPAHSRSEPRTVEQAASDAMAALARPAVTSPDRLDLRLEDVRANAIANNLDLKVELVNPAIASAAVDRERAKFESAFTFSARRSEFDSPPSVGTEGSQSEIDDFDLGVRIPLRTGGEVNVNLPFSKTDTDNPFSLLNPAYEADLRFSISQPLLRNAGIRVNEYSILIAEHQESIARARTKLEAIRILANADRAYWTLYAARRELEVRQQEYEVAVALLERARRRVDAGDAASIEVTRAESGLAQRLEAIIVADTAVKRAQRDLKRIMRVPDVPLSSATALVTVSDPAPVGLDLDPAALCAFAVQNRMEMLELELQLAIDASTVNLEKNAALPLLVLDYSYAINGLGSTYGRAFDQLPDRSFEDWSVGLRGEIPLGNEAAKARVHQAVLQRLQRLATREQRELAIEQEVRDALDGLEQAWQRILAARQAALLAGRTLEGEERQFAQGMRTSTDVLDAAASLADAQSAEIRALADYQIAQVDIAFATGTLLGSGRVAWPEFNEPAGYP